MKIAIGSDHRGRDAGDKLVGFLKTQGHVVDLLGDTSSESCDYPDSAYLVGQAVNSGDADRGILLCSNGIGMSIAANKIPGVRAALVYDQNNAQKSKKHNDANVLCLSGESTPTKQLHEIVEAWLETDFQGGRHADRVEKINAIERGENPTKIANDHATA